MTRQAIRNPRGEDDACLSLAHVHETVNTANTMNTTMLSGKALKIALAAKLEGLLRGWGWFDLAGNHRLDVPGFLHLQHTGNKSAQAHPRPTANLSTREAGRVTHALLLPEHAGIRWTQRHMEGLLASWRRLFRSQVSSW